ncbi:hypothetical protein NXZ75_13660 [Lysinibacillus sphaericus]|uniref:hypothetical protein n=1 Tax=Lysinibacillus sphaericus TaxID=1421 RepID=UPI002163C43C|nr:hypothetical protein [Lysinibacillus sphaericus]MCS1383248.1 hypothetical protein [Lysinibacillus sphaericus]
MSENITGEISCICGNEVRWIKVNLAKLISEKLEWRGEDGRIEVDKNNQVRCECGLKHNIN